MKITRRHIKASWYGEHDDFFFTKEELVEFGEEVCNQLNLHYPKYQFEIQDLYVDDLNKVNLHLIDEDGWVGAGVSFVIDMRKIRKPSDLNKYITPVVNMFIAELDSQINDTEYSQGVQTIEGAYTSPLERPIDPPDPEEYDSLEDVEEVFEIRFDMIDGEPYVGGGYAWAVNPDRPYGAWKSENYDMVLAYPDDISYAVDSLIENLPEYQNKPPGKYRLKGYAELCFNISGLESESEVFRDGSYDEQIYTESAEVEFVEDKSLIKDFEMIRIEDE